MLRAASAMRMSLSAPRRARRSSMLLRTAICSCRLTRPPRAVPVPRHCFARLRLERSRFRAGTAPLLRPLAAGAVAVLGLLVFYLGIITLAQGWAHASAQLVDDRPFIAAIVVGFGTQVGLYTYLRGLHARTAVGGVAASSGTSAAAMLACCAHHLADVLPMVGVAGAAVFLNTYKTPLLWLSIAMNLAGVVYLLRKIRQQHQMVCHTPFAHRGNISYGND